MGEHTLYAFAKIVAPRRVKRSVRKKGRAPSTAWGTQPEAKSGLTRSKNPIPLMGAGPGRGIDFRNEDKARAMRIKLTQDETMCKSRKAHGPAPTLRELRELRKDIGKTRTDQKRVRRPHKDRVPVHLRGHSKSPTRRGSWTRGDIAVGSPAASSRRSRRQHRSQ